MRHCKNCQQRKPPELFKLYHVKGMVYRRNWCIECWNQRKREKAREYNRTEHGARKQLNNNLSRYGITVEEYEELLALQNYKCAICERLHTSLKRRLHVDHCHKTGVIRGLLCQYCNVALGSMCESAELLRRAAKYVEGR